MLTKQKVFKDKPRIRSNSGKLTNWLTAGTSDKPVVIAEDGTEPIVLREDDEEPINLEDIPEAGRDNIRARNSPSNKRRRSPTSEDAVSNDSDTDDSFQSESAPITKRTRRHGSGTTADEVGSIEDAQDDKKKLGLNTSYEGFSIYGRILCLVVKRRGQRAAASASGPPVSSQQMLENWVSTQAAAEQVNDDDDNG